MGKQRMIYLSEEIDQKLRLETNASALISILLEEYYKVGKFKGTTLEDINKKLNEIKEVTEEEKKLINLKKQLEEEERLQEEKINKEICRKTSLDEQRRKNILTIFNEEMGREMTDLEYLNYTSKLATEEKGFNIWTFVDKLKGNNI